MYSEVTAARDTSPTLSMVGVKLWAKPYSYSYVFEIDGCSIINFQCGRVRKLHGSLEEPHMCQAHGTFKVGILMQINLNDDRLIHQDMS